MAPLLVCTDQEPALAAREYASMPMVLVLPHRRRSQRRAGRPAAAGRAEPRPALDAAHPGPRLMTFELGRNRLALPERAEEDRGLVTARLAELAESFDLAEPFHRIRAAIEEAQQAVR